MRRLLSLLAFVCLAAGVLAATPGQDTLTLFSGAKNLIHPGSPGWLSACSANFGLTNTLLYSQQFSLWSKGSTGGPAVPTVTDNAATAPDNSTTASQVAFPAVGASQNSVLYQSEGLLVQGAPETFDIWVKGAVGGETIWISTNPGTLPLTDQKIVATTSWQHYTLKWSQGNGPSTYFEIGIDTRTPTDETPTSAQTVYLWGAQNNYMWNSIYNSIGAPYVPTTTASATKNYSLPCPPNTAFRDFSTLTAYSGNPVISQNTAPTNGGGVNSLYADPAITLPNSSTYFAMSEWRNISGSYAWNGFGEYETTDFKNWTLNSTTPAITTSANTWKDHYMLRPRLTKTCSLGVYCVYYSAVNNSGAISGGSTGWSVGVSYSNDGLTWTDYAGNPVISTNPINNYASPGLPALLTLNGSLSMYVTYLGKNGCCIWKWHAPAANTTSFSFDGFALLPAAPSDWDSINNGIIDPMVWRNNHGFYEMVYTAEATGGQKIGYAISEDGSIWYKRGDAPILTNASLGAVSTFIGDFQVAENKGVFNMLYTWDNGSNASAGYLATMVDY